MRYTKPCLLLTFLMFALLTQGQIDKERFEKIFEEETRDDRYRLRENHSSKYQYSPAQDIPEWFIKLPQASSNEIIAIGISDPGMDTTQGFNMALQRALLMGSILNHSTTQLLCYYFSDEEDHKYNVVYEHYSRIVAKQAKNMENYKVLHQHYNAYNETIVLLKLKREMETEEYEEIGFELYKNETQTNVFGAYESVYELFLNNQSYYQLTEFGTRSDVVSTLRDSSIKVPIYSLNYHSPFNTERAYLSHGLWKAYYKSMMTQIIALAKQKPENISAISDRYRTNSYEQLTRGISINRMHLRLAGISIKNNNIAINIEER